MLEYDVSDHDPNIEHDYLATVVWSGMLIWAGVVLLAGFEGCLKSYPLPDLVWFPFLRKWLQNYAFDFRVIPLIFVGDALILLLELLTRLVFPSLRHRLTNILINIVIFTCLAAGSYGLIQGILLVPIILITIGISILLGLLFRRRKPRRKS